jgi:hypothetical protein
VIEEFDNLARKALAEAARLARVAESAAVGTDHLVRAAMHIAYSEPGNEGLVQTLGGKGRLIESEGREMSRPNDWSPGIANAIPLSPRFRQALELAVQEAERLGSPSIGIQHLLLALADQPSGPGVDLLQSVGFDLNEFHTALLPRITPQIGRLVTDEVDDVPLPRPVPLPPDFSTLPSEVVDDLAERLQRIPADHIRRRGDYWALWSVERDHIARLADQFGLGKEESDSLYYWWRDEVTMRYPRLRDTIEHTHTRSMLHSMPRIRPKFLFQLWFNTIGPGGRCWFGNRYTTIRHYTFRVHWRP